MSLKSVPNSLSDEAHTTMGSAVVKAIKKPPPEDYLLMTIVAHSDGLLHPKYNDIRHATALVENNQQLAEMLATAWEKRQFRDIRNLGALLNPPHTHVLLSHDLSLKLPKQRYFKIPPPRPRECL